MELRGYSPGSGSSDPCIDNHNFGSKILNIEYGSGDQLETLSDAGNDQGSFLSGTVLKSEGDGLVGIYNSSLQTKITLDWSNRSHLIRTSEDGKVEQAGTNSAGQQTEVWVDFGWNGPFEGDFYRPFNSISSAVAAVADGGVIRIVPGLSRDRTPIHRDGKRIRIIAPIGDVSIGAR